jgi:hypothetical protein
LIIYSHSITPRLQYVIDFLSQYYFTPIKLTSNEQKYIDTTEACKLNYSYHRIADDEIWIHPHPLLSESAVRPVKAECFAYAGTKAFFKTEGHVPFDIFAAIFFLLTRYEEYLPHHKDIYGRYAHTDSLAFKEEFLHLPLINLWLEAFRKLLQEKDPECATQHPKFAFVPTYDIDMAWSFKNKGFQRNAGAILQLLTKVKFGGIVRRIKVLTNKVQDPFDAYEWMDNLHQQYNLQPIYFFLVADKVSKLDKNISVKNPFFQQLIRDTAARYTIGLHPSWQSGDVRFLLKKEKGTLETLSNHTIHYSRQHYIRFTLPETYRRLIEAGITHDYSMGYGSINGFRASIATPFYWYDLQKEEKTNLMIHPFCFMDANAYYEQSMAPQQAVEELKHYRNIIQAVNGTMCTIWHNSFLGTDPEFEGWPQVYEQFVASLRT